MVRDNFSAKLRIAKYIKFDILFGRKVVTNSGFGSRLFSLQQPLRFAALSTSPYTGEAFTPTALITLSAQFTSKFLVYRYVLSLRIRVNQSLSRFFFVQAEATLNRIAIQHEVFLCRYKRQSCCARPQNFTRTTRSVVPKLQKKRRTWGAAPNPVMFGA